MKLATLLLLVACTWGQAYESVFGYLGAIDNKLDRIEARLDSLAYVPAKVPTLEWKVCLDSTWYVYDGPEGRTDSLVSHETWWLYVVKDTRKFRVCKLEEITE